MSKYLDLDYLRYQQAKPQWFGLGFIQMKISNERRLHFWHPDLAPNLGNAEEVHNHRYDFTSSVIKGEMENEVWEMVYDEAGDYRLWRVSCQPGNADSAEMVGPMTVADVATYTIRTGGSYTMPQPIFHRSFPKGHTVTMLKRGKVTEDYAYVIRSATAQHNCPFAVSIPEPVLWERIEEILYA